MAEDAVTPYHFKRRGAASKIEYNALARKKSVATRRRRSWVSDKEAKTCTKCAVTFDWFVRKHHCRKCGDVYCGPCSGKQSVVAGCGAKPVRVCGECFEELRLPASQRTARRRSTHFSGAVADAAPTASLIFMSCPKISRCDVCFGLWQAVGCDGFHCDDGAGEVQLHRECRQIAEQFPLYQRTLFRPLVSESGHARALESAAGTAGQEVVPAAPSVAQPAAVTVTQLHKLVEGLIGTLVVEIESATEIRTNKSGSYFGKGGNPYVKFNVRTSMPTKGVSATAAGSAPQRTKAAVKGGANPVWTSAHNNRHTIALPLKPDACPLLFFEVWNENSFVDDRLGTACVNLAPVLLNPGMVFRRLHACWDDDQLQAKVAAHGVAVHESGASDDAREPECMLMVSVRFTPTQNVYSCCWEPHKFASRPFLRSLAPSLCGICGNPVMGPLPSWQSCTVCGKDVHTSCLSLVNARLPCKPSIVRSHALEAHDAKLETQAIGTLFLHLDIAHICQPECTALYHVRVHKDDTQALKAAQEQAAAKRGAASREGDTSRLTEDDGTSPLSDVTGLSVGRTIFCRVIFEGRTVSSPTYLLGRGRDPTLNLQLAYYVGNSRSHLLVELVDGVSLKVIGECVFSILDVVEQMSTVRFGGAPEQFGLDSPGPTVREQKDFETKGGLQWFALLPSGEALKPKASEAAALEQPKGFVTMRLYWHQDPLKCLDVDPPKIKPPMFDVEELKDNVLRLQGIIAWIDFFTEGGGKIFSWEDKSYSLTCLAIFLHLSLNFDWSRFLCLPTGFLFLGLAWNYRKRLTGAYDRDWMDAVGTPELSTLTLKTSVFEVSFVPDDSDDENSEDESKVEAKCTEVQQRAGELLPDLCLEVYYVAKEKASGDGVEQLIGQCWPDIRIDVDNDSDDEQAAKGAGWGLDSFLGAGQALAEGTAASAARVSAIVAAGTARAPVAGYGASLIEQDDRTTGSEAEGGAKASSGTTMKLPVAGFQFNMIQPLTSAGGREVPLPWADNKGTVVFRAKIPVAKRDPALPKTIPDKAGMCLIGEKELPLQDLLKQAENDAGDEERHCVELETPEDEENSPDRGLGADPMQLDLTALVSLDVKVVAAAEGKEKELEEALRKQNEALDKAKKEQAEPGLSMFETYRQVKMQAREVQNLIGNIAGQLESMKNLLTWAYPPMTVWILYASLIATVVTYFFPTPWILFAGGLYMFGDGLYLRLFPSKSGIDITGRKKRNAKKKEVATEEEEPMADWEKFVMQVPNDRDLRRAFTVRKEVIMANRQRRSRIAELEAVWQGLLTVIEPSGVKPNRFVVVRPREIVWWKTLEAAESGKPAKGSLTFKQILILYIPLADKPEGTSEEERNALAGSTARIAGDPAEGKSVAAGAKPLEIDFVAQEGGRQRGELLSAIKGILGGAQVEGAELYEHAPPDEVRAHAFMMSHEVTLYCNGKAPKGKSRRQHSPRKGGGTRRAPAKETAQRQQSVDEAKSSQNSSDGAREKTSARSPPRAPPQQRSEEARPGLARAVHRSSTTLPDGPDGSTVTESVNEHGNRVVKRVVRRTVQRQAGIGMDSMAPKETVEFITTPDGKRKKITRRIVRKIVARAAPASDA